FNEIINLIDSKYVNLITNDMIDNYLENKGLFIDSENGVIKAYLINSNDELNRGTLIDGNNADSDITNGTPDVSITDDPEKVVSGDTPDDEIPIFDDLVTTEPSDIVTDTVTGENETETETPEKQEEEERENEESSEEDDNSKKADTDIEKEFVSDIEEVEKLIEDMKEFVGDAENVSVEEEAIAEVDELIETVKDYVNEV
ncbi:MAG: hypothetical protein K2I70_05965, partial [Bacilli bacterium]|nr:hypothetical protein [Bacilli bacterium]